MIHLGDITKISGYKAPVVDVVVGGSPCQDLSVAGKRAGLDGERSGLFMEQIRIVKEMRKQDEQRGRTGVAIRPRYMLWENVPGAFSSNGSEDFRIVLEETAKVADKNATIPMPPKGKWTNSGCIMGDGWSIAWRVCDAQFWGVPQRRRRIALVADFGGESAPEILFVRKGVSGNTEPSEQKRKEATCDATRGFGANDRLGADQYNAVILGDTVSTIGVNCGMSHGRQCVLEPVTFEPGIASREGGHIYEGVSGTLRANAGDNQMATAYGISAYDSNAMKSSNPHSGIYEADTARTLDGNGGNPSCNQGGIVIVDSIGGNAERGWEGDVAPTLKATHYKSPPNVVYSVENHPADSRVDIDESGKCQTLTSRMGTGGGNVPMVLQCYSKSKRAQSSTDNETWVESDTANTINAFDVGDTRTTEAVVYALDRASFNQGKNAQYDFEITDSGVNSTVVAKGPGAVCYATGNGQVAGTGLHQKVESLNCMHDPQAVMVKKHTHYIVRRLTPLECERLQGFPDGWTDIGEWVDSKGKKHKDADSPRYKALGNSISLPNWKFVLKRLSACYERDATMASLFDGIGGFPYLWEQLNGKGSCLWASEIEEFPMAVTKVRGG